MAFYQIGAVYYQKSKLSNEEAGSENTNTIYIASDSKGPVGGSVSYQQNNETKLINVSLAAQSLIKVLWGLLIEALKVQVRRNQIQLTSVSLMQSRHFLL